MSTPTIDYDALAEQARTAKSVDYDALAAQARSAPDLTVNTINPRTGTGYGTYDMWDDKGQKQPIPYNNVPLARAKGYQFDTNKNQGGLTPAQQFTRDEAADPNRVGGTSMMMAPAGARWTGQAEPQSRQESLQRLGQAETNASLPMRVLTGVMKGGATLARPAIDVMNLRGNTPQEQNYMMEGRTPAETAAKVGTIAAGLAPAIPAAIAAGPVATVGGLAGGALGAGAGQVIGDVAGMDPRNTAVLSDVLGLGAGAAGGMGGKALTSKYFPSVDEQGLVGAVRNYLRPPTSPSIVPREEMAARNLTAAILPANKEAPGFIESAQKEVPNILDYAKRTNNPLNTQLEFSKAAQGYAQEVRDLYEQRVLGPVENKLVKTTGTGYGSRMQEGPDTYATLGDIDNRVISLNKQLSAPSINVGDERRALASRAEIQDEARGLTKILHDNLADATGLSPDEVANLRQRVGRSWDLANDTNAAVTARMQASGRTDLGPIKVGELPSAAVRFARGGPVPIADRAFQKAIRSFPGQAQALPQIEAPVTMRPALSPAEAQAQRWNQLLALAREQQARVRGQ